jgi:hypothetical protein
MKTNAGSNALTAAKAIGNSPLIWSQVPIKHRPPNENRGFFTAKETQEGI